ncbi:MAG: glycine cleavage system protein GcvH [Deltaproteobacteria bacterium]
MNIPKDLKYTKDHEWLKINGDTGIVGVTEFATHELGDIVYVEVDTVGEVLEKEDVFGTVEAVKTTSDLFLPVSGEILEFNPEIDENEGDNPGVINEDPYGKGWIVKIKIINLDEIDELLDYKAYEELIS